MSTEGKQGTQVIRMSDFSVYMFHMMIACKRSFKTCSGVHVRAPA